MRFGLLGTGHWAREVHAKALAAHEGVEFVGVWGRNPDATVDIAEEHQIQGFRDVDALLAAVDAVAIALPPHVQAELALKAALQGCHLLLDKPLALTVEAADAVVEAVDAKGLKSVIFFTSRFQPSTVEVLKEATGKAWHGGRSTLFGAIADTPFDASPWRHEHGGLWDLGPHALSLLLPVLGPVTGVKAMHGPQQSSYVLLKHESGPVSTMELTIHAAPAEGKNETMFHGEPGWLTLPGFDGDALGSFSRAISELLEGGPDHPLNVHFGREVTRILVEATI
ncbi:Gfo/Idh/MocA family protein [Catelliglobosispora koreensis]|uniref:Gfo/Idh/MocA family protein n=1 Tax=Catelliglobosispora koreensis TaxID=129052 RepID=UPI00036630FE|nr:Gfo/Idh/MocA family oxidoreductase [Catelliglobosispora koreensis]